MRASEFIDSLEESRARRAMASVLAAAALAGGAAGLKGSTPGQEKYKTTQTNKKTKRLTVPTLTNSPKERYLRDYAQSQGIEGQELAQLMGQANHETMGFAHMIEWNNPKKIVRKYDPKFAPKTAKILGNTRAGDGFKYRGRGYLMLTGRDNYYRAGRALGLDLINNPDLAADTEVAAKIAVWYWNNRVKSGVEDWSISDQVTRKINPAGFGSQQRAELYQLYSKDFQ